MYRTFWTVVLGVVATASLPTVVTAADAKPAAAGAKMKLGLESPTQANARFSRFKLDIAKGDAAPTAPAGALTVEELSTMLENMGYEPKIGQYSDGGKYITVNVSQGVWNISITADLSPDKSMVWLSVYLTKVEDPTKVPLDAALKLLDAEQTVWPSYFVYSVQYKNIYIYRPVPNTGIKPATLRTTLNALMTNIDATSTIWDTAVWNPK